MCGIAGILVPADRPVDERALRAMTAALAPRGPDGEGYHLTGAVGLGHRRLAVIDPAGGQQPLYSEDGAVVGVVNGEIYNFRELRRELESCGHRFATRSDSEVLIHGYEAWGLGVLARIEGMFAFALWDEPARRLILARDRLGEKPLFWAELGGGGLAFASELKALQRCPGVDCEIDSRALARYLVYEYVPAPASIIRGARKLAPGHQLVVEPGGTPRVERYWDLPLPSDPGDRRFGARQGRAAAAVLLEELRRSVRERLVADVPLGVFLSGGIDSSTIAALAAEQRGGELDTFCVGFDQPSFDQTAAARSVARHLGSRHHEAQLSSARVLELLPAIGELLDEPLGDGSIVPTHLLARFARERVTVAVGGDGGDELFAGYQTFLAEPLGRLLFDQAPPSLARAAGVLGGLISSALPISLDYLSLDFKLRQFLKGEGEHGARRHQCWLGSFSPKAAHAVLNPDLAAAAGADLLDDIDSRLRGCPSPDPWDRLLYFYAKGYLADDVLTKVDRATMAVGLEARSPLLDSRIVELACRVSPWLRQRGLEGKHLLKRATRELLPAAVRRRPKRGFGMPIGHWLRGPLRSLMEEELGAAHLRDQGLFQAAPVRQLVEEHLAGRGDHHKPLWTLIAFQRWWRAWQEL